MDQEKKNVSLCELYLFIQRISSYEEGLIKKIKGFNTLSLCEKDFLEKDEWNNNMKITVNFKFEKNILCFVNLNSSGKSSFISEIEDYVFSDCVNLQKIIFPENLKKIGKCSFKNCTSLEELYFPNTLKEIGDSAFYDCDELETIRFEEDSELEIIGSYAFYNCYNIDGNEEEFHCYFSLKEIGSHNCDFIYNSLNIYYQDHLKECCIIKADHSYEDPERYHTHTCMKSSYEEGDWIPYDYKYW